VAVGAHGDKVHLAPGRLFDDHLRWVAFGGYGLDIEALGAQRRRHLLEPLLALRLHVFAEVESGRDGAVDRVLVG